MLGRELAQVRVESGDVGMMILNRPLPFVQLLPSSLHVLDMGGHLLRNVCELLLRCLRLGRNRFLGKLAGPLPALLLENHVSHLECEGPHAVDVCRGKPIQAARRRTYISKGLRRAMAPDSAWRGGIDGRRLIVAAGLAMLAPCPPLEVLGAST